MTVEELIEAARNSVIDDERLAALIEVVEEAQRIFEEDEKRRTPTQEDLNRTYNL